MVPLKKSGYFTEVRRLNSPFSVWEGEMKGKSTPDKAADPFILTSCLGLSWLTFIKKTCASLLSVRKLQTSWDVCNGSR